MTGRFIAVVGPSGVGKDSLIAGLCAAHADMLRIRRVITRNAALGGEDFDAVSAEQFREMASADDFCLQWQAHGLSYGIPQAALGLVQSGCDVIANLSRAALLDAAALFSRIVVVSVTATPETLARRLSSRGREDEGAIRARLARQVPVPPGLPMIAVPNDGALDQAVQTALAALYPVRS